MIPRALSRFWQLPDSQALLLLSSIVILFFVSKWIFGGAIFYNDIVTIYAPLEELYGQLQRTGASPLWAPEIRGGYPLLGNGQLGFWYVPHMVLRQFFSGAWVINLSLLLHSLLGVIGVFYLLRRHALSRLAAASAALLFVFGGAITGKYEIANVVFPMMWAPLLMLLLYVFLRSGKPAVLLWWVIASALQLMSGHPQITMLVVLIEIVYGICVVMSLQNSWWRRVLFLLLGSAVALGLALPHIAPILANVPESDRAEGVTPEELFSFSFEPEALRGLAHAHPFGHLETYQGPKNEPELATYIGPVALLAAIFGLLAGFRKYSLLWAAALLLGSIGVVFALGEHSLPYRLLVLTADFHYFSVPARFFFMTHVALVFLSAIGLDILKRRLGRFSTFVTSGVVAALLIPPLIVGWLWYPGIPWRKLTAPPLTAILKADAPGRLFASYHLVDAAPNNNFGVLIGPPVHATTLLRQDFVSPYDTLTGIAVQFSVADQKQAGDVTLRLFSAEGNVLRESMLTNTALHDSDWTAFSFPALPNARQQTFFFELSSSLSSKQAPKLFVHTNPAYDPTGQLSTCKNEMCSPLTAGENQTDASFILLTESPALPAAYAVLAGYNAPAAGIGSSQWIGALPLQAVALYFKDGGESDRGLQEKRSFINRFGISHLIGLTPPHRTVKHLVDVTLIETLPHGDALVSVYKNNQVFPRVHFAGHVVSEPDWTKHRERMAAFFPTDQATVVADVSSSRDFSLDGSITAIEDARSSLLVHIETAAESFLVVRDVLSSGWHATIDGVPTPIIRTDSIFRGIVVPAGQHAIEFHYRPAWIVPIQVIFSVSTLIMIIWIFFLIQTLRKTGLHNH